MNLGKINHPYFGPCHTYILPYGRILEYRQQKNKIGKWLTQFNLFKKIEWHRCFFPYEIIDSEYQTFKVDKNKPNFFRIKYEGFYVVSLAQQIRKRKNKKFNFTGTEILYIMANAVKAWREWQYYSIQNKYSLNNFAISSSSLLLNQQGEIRMIIPISSPLSVPKIQYYAPENCPPNKESLESWNRSISFSIGLIGYEMLSLQIASPFYKNEGSKIKFDFQQYEKWLHFIDNQSKNGTLNELTKIVVNLVKLLTQRNPFIRMKLGQLEAFLNPVIKKILEGESVELNKKDCHKSLVQYLTQGKDQLQNSKY